MIIKIADKITPNPEVKKVFIRVNVWGNYGAYIGTKKVLDGKYKPGLIDLVGEYYPNAEIIDKTKY